MFPFICKLHEIKSDNDFDQNIGTSCKKGRYYQRHFQTTEKNDRPSEGLFEFQRCLDIRVQIYLFISKLNKVNNFDSFLHKMIELPLHEKGRYFW